MPLKKIVIHPGLPKTGTSSIQQTLYRNNRVLERSGFYFMTEWSYPNHSAILYNLFRQPFDASFWLNVSNNFDEKTVIELNELNTKKLIDAVNNSFCETLILSGEELINLDFNYDSIAYVKSFFERYFSGAEVEAVFYVRSPIPMLVSLYQEFVCNNDALIAKELILDQNRRIP